MKFGFFFSRLMWGGAISSLNWRFWGVRPIDCWPGRISRTTGAMSSALYSRKELEGGGFGPYAVLEIPHFVVELKDGTGLASKVWFPVSKAAEAAEILTAAGFSSAAHNVYCQQNDLEQRSETAFPCILEYLPYRKSDYTARRDHLRHPWMASHGFVVFRTDLRGSGDSSGLYYDEYAKQEQDDACELIAWMAEQKWCTGNVGMYGKSWGGFNGLQLAYRQPPALKAIITLYSTDNRYTDDIHYRGGCVLGNGMLSWASQMQAWNARPPQPTHFPDSAAWEEEWKKRLEANVSQSWAKLWLDHQSYDSYWAHGSVCEDTSLLSDVAVLAIGGWHDGYRDAVFRLVRDLPSNKCRAIIGPWSHEWPDIAVPGPNIGFTSECLDFWRHHLKGQRSRRQDEAPRLIWYQCEGLIAPGPLVTEWPGKWMSVEDFCSVGAKELAFFADEDEQGRKTLKFQSQNLGKEWNLNFNLEAGLKCGEWLSFGAPDLPGDQASTFHQALTFISDPAQDDLAIFGFPTLKCAFSLATDDRGMVATRLCDVFPETGEARLITHGIRNLNRDGSGAARCLKLNTWYDLELALDSVGYTVKSGHQLALCISPAYWPYAWPSRMDPGISIRSVSFKLPLVAPEAKDAGGVLMLEPKLGPALESEVLRKAKFQRNLQVGMSSDMRKITLLADDGRTFLPHLDSTLDEIEDTEYSSNRDDPKTARVTTVRALAMKVHGGRQVDIRYQATMESPDGEQFSLTNDLRVEREGQEFFSRKWEEKIKRNFV